METKQYNFSPADIKFRKYLEKRRGEKIPDQEFYQIAEKQRKLLREFAVAVKTWAIENPYEAKQLKELVNGWEEKRKNKELYGKVAKIKKLTIVELEKLLVPELEKAGYIKFQLESPEIEKDVIVPFITQESKSDRTDRVSEYDLKRLIKKALQDTNWRLMTDGVSYKLGILSGRLRGLEGPDEISVSN